jgi:hypothetical protein
MNAIRSFWFLILVAVLSSSMSLSGAIPRVTHAALTSADTTGYNADADYVLVKDCLRGVCAAPADWRPGEQSLHELFVQQGWGQDPAVVSQKDPHRVTWGQWAADHLYYVDEASPAARRAALTTALHDPRGRSIYIVRVPALR